MDNLMKHVIASLVFTGIGIAVFGVAFVIIKAITPFSIRKELEEDQNTSVAIVTVPLLFTVALLTR